MLLSELLEIIANGENSGVEFKRDDVRPEQIAKEISALANFQGGKLLLGVEDDGTISGIQRDNLELWIMDTVFGRYIHPMILPSYKEILVDSEHRVAIITITQGITKPYVVRHNGREEAYIRVGSTSRRATREQLAKLYALGGMLHAEMLPVSGSSLNDLSLERLSDYLVNIVGDSALPDNNEEWVVRLCGLGFMIEQENASAVCSIAGLVLFGHKPRRLLRQAGIRWMAFSSQEKTYDALDDRTLDGPLVGLGRTTASGREIIENGLIESVIESMRPFISQESDQINESMLRKRSWHYPLEAIREAVVNALVHRDWTRYEEVEVVAYDNRLDVTSPGALQNSMTIEKMIAGQRSPRNPLIIEVLRDYGYVEARGMGVRNKIIPLLKEMNGVEPDISATEDYVRIVMPKRQKG